MKRRKEKPRSAWFQGLLDAEAKCLTEPCDWDWDTPAYWQEYEAGARAYRQHRSRFEELLDDGMCNPDNPEMRCICREEFGYRVCVPSNEVVGP